MPWIRIITPKRSNETARRNAHRAAIICAQRRKERDAIEAYLAARAAWATGGSNPAPAD